MMFDMGVHAIYVWPAYLIVLVVLVVNLLAPRRQHRRLLESLARRMREEQQP